MIFQEINKDLFTVDKSYYLCHCIASDFIMGAGIAVEFQRRFQLRKYLQSLRTITPGSCVLIKNVFNLITKSRSSGKPTYDILKSSLESMKQQCINMKIEKIAMPKIGCGLDRLQWPKVKEMIIEIFNDTNIEILVCNLER